MSINVPNDKARAVVDAMEMDMLAKLATKSDLAHAQELLSKDIKTVSLDLAHAREVLSREVQLLAANLEALSGKTDTGFQSLDKKFVTKADLAEFGEKSTTKLYKAMAAVVVLNCSILGTLVVFLR